VWPQERRKAQKLSRMSAYDGAMYVRSKEEEIFKTNKLEKQKGYRRIGKSVLIRDWAEELAKPTEYNNGVAACPFALPAIEAGEVNMIFTEDLWADVLRVCKSFDELDFKVNLIWDHFFEGSYEQLEAGCMKLNEALTEMEEDIWLLCYLGDDAIVFVQRWSELENAAAKLEKLGYYTNYNPQEYERLILGRRNRRQ